MCMGDSVVPHIQLPQFPCNFATLVIKNLCELYYMGLFTYRSLFIRLGRVDFRELRILTVEMGGGVCELFW